MRTNVLMMRINVSKTKFFVICGNMEDNEPLRLGELTVEHRDRYTCIYLGAPFTSHGSVSSAVKVHAAIKMAHVNKFVDFLKKNYDIPFIVKKRIFHAALMSSILYGCESWLNLRPVSDKIM